MRITSSKDIYRIAAWWRAMIFTIVCILLAALSLPLGGQKVGASADSHLREQMGRAVSAAQHGDEHQALTLTDALLHEHPDFGPALKLQGMLLEDMGRSPEAAVPYQRALELSPNDPELLLKVGIYHLVTGDKDQAIGELVHLLRVKPLDGDARYYLAQAYYLKGDNKLALKVIREGLKIEPGSASIMQKYGELLCSSGDNEAALEWLHKAQHKDNSLDRLDFDLAVASYKGMHLEDAVMYSKKAVDVHPKDLNALALLAAAYVKLSRWQDAEPIFQKILLVKSDDVSSLLGIGHCELELKHYQASIEALNHLLQEDPTQMLAHFYLSRDFMGLGDAAEAQREADLHSNMMDRGSSAASAGDTATEKAIWAKARKLLVENNETDALHLFRVNSRGPSATPGEPYVLVGALYLYMGRREDAMRNLKQAQKIEPTVLGSHTYLGMLALEEGDLNTAENEFEVEIARHPTYQMAIAELGEVRYRQGRWPEAVDQLARSKTVEPTLLYMLCDSYFHLGNIKDADLIAELATAYARGDAEFMRGLVYLLNRNQQTELAQRLGNKTAQ